MSKLKKWSLGHHSNNIYQLEGLIYDDARFDDGLKVTTSRLKSIDFENNIAKTLNTVYELEPTNENKNVS